ncbi:MAG: anti-sigma factor [Pseudomonadota bacterium]
MTTQTAEPDWNLLSAEYVLRLLPEREERAFEAALAKTPRLHRLVAHWIEQFEGLDTAFGSERPRGRAKKELFDRLFGEAPQGARAGASAGSSAGATSGGFGKFVKGLFGGGNSAGFAAGAAVAVAGFVVVNVMTGPTERAVPDAPVLAEAPVAPASPAVSFVAEIAAEDDSLRILAAYSPVTGQVQLTRTAGAAREGRALELWAIAGEAAPVSLGVLPTDTLATVDLPEALREVEGLILAVSDEPPGGSTTGAPTGDVLALGQTVGI